VAARHTKAGHVKSWMLSNYPEIKIQQYIYIENSPLLDGISNTSTFKPVQGKDC
jgi:hypothetical protein